MIFVCKTDLIKNCKVMVKTIKKEAKPVIKRKTKTIEDIRNKYKKAIKSHNL